MAESDDETAVPSASAAELTDLVERVEQRLLGGSRKYTRAEVAAASGLPPEGARELWQAMGFAAVDDDERAFTDGDIEALRRVRGFSGTMALDDELLRSMTRMLGRSFSRLASWQGQVVLEQFARSPELVASGGDLVEHLDGLLTTMQDLQTYVWRRQLAAYFSRIATNAAVATGAETTMAVGFADMAQFTTLTRHSSEAELRAVLESFETIATDIAGAHRGQIVKTIGDEVLFVADEPRDAAEIALELVTAAEGSDILPALRVGLAAGPVVSRLGDVFGQTVNIASRLTSVARAGSVLVDEGMSLMLADRSEYTLRSLRPVSVRGYHHLRSWRLRRSTDSRHDS